MRYAEKKGFAAIAFSLCGLQEDLFKNMKRAGGIASNLIEKTDKISFGAVLKKRTTIIVLSYLLPILMAAKETLFSNLSES